MFYELMGRAHAAGMRLRAEAGQGTVEYVGLLILIGVLLTGVVVAMRGMKDGGIAKTLVEQLSGAVDKVAGQAK